MIPRLLQGVPTVAISSALFAVMAVLARSVAGQMPAGQLAFIRMATGLVLLGGWFLLTRTKPSIRRRPGLLFARGLLGGLSVLLWFYALEHLQVGPATLLNNTAPAYAALFGTLFLRERATAALIVGISVAMVGAAVVIWSTLEPGQTFSLGIGALAGLLSAVMSGAAMTTMRALRQDTDTLTVLFSFCLVSSLISLPVAVAEGSAFAAEYLPHAIVVGILSMVAQLLLTHAFRYVPVMTGSATTQLTTVFSWTLGVLILGEQATPLGLVGAAICIAGVVIASGVGGQALLRARGMVRGTGG